MKIGVIGSRDFTDWTFLCEQLDRYDMVLEDIHIVSGGARGADSLGIKWAKLRGKPYTEHLAAWDQINRPGAVVKSRQDGTLFDALAGFNRNQLIIDDSHIIIAFMDPKAPTPGTSDTIKKARKAGKPVYVLWNIKE